MFASLILAWRVCAAADTEQTDPVDWPVAIARLQQQLMAHPHDPGTRAQLGTAYNNHGVQLANEGKWEMAIQQLKSALQFPGAAEQARKNLAMVYVNQAGEAYRHHQLETATQTLKEALSLDSAQAHAHALLGQIQYDQQKLKEAKATWQQAFELDPTQTVVGERLNRVSKELGVESSFERLAQAHFDLRYEERLERPVGFDVRDALLEARRGVGSDFAHWPKYKIVVLIYSHESFKALRQQTPEWVAGQFDGKIRVPFPSADLDQAEVQRIIFHEYTHAVIHEIAQGKCPTWLNEGLAEYEGRTQLNTPLTQLPKAHANQRLIPWAELSNAFSFDRSAHEVSLAYEQSYSIVSYLIERSGFWRIRRALKAIGEGTPWEDVFVREYRLKLPKLMAQWSDWLPEFFMK